jgi:hypothetical protein
MACYGERYVHLRKTAGSFKRFDDSRWRLMASQDLMMALIPRVYMIYRYRVTAAVVQPGFWDDLPAMQRLFAALGSDQFRQVASIPVESNVPHEETSLEILQNSREVATSRAPMSVDMPLIGQRFTQ